MPTTTTRVLSVSLQVADQDRALAFYVDVLGCQLRADMELWPGARWVEVVAPGTDVGIALLTAESGLPIGLRLGTDDADATHAALHAAGAELGEEVGDMTGGGAARDEERLANFGVTEPLTEAGENLSLPGRETKWIGVGLHPGTRHHPGQGTEINSEGLDNGGLAWKCPSDPLSRTATWHLWQPVLGRKPRSSARPAFR